MSALENQSLVHKSFAFVALSIVAENLVPFLESANPRLYDGLSPLVTFCLIVSGLILLAYFVSALFHALENDRPGWFWAVFLTGPFGLTVYALLVAPSGRNDSGAT